MQISLGTLEPMKGDMGKQEYEVAMAWIRDNIDFMRAEWERLNG
jgi:hypothetical protein